MRDSAATPLSTAEQADLRRLAEAVVPSSDEFGIPGAGDLAITDDMLATMGRDTAAIRRALAAINADVRGEFAALSAPDQTAVAARYLAAGGADAATLGRVILQCYYRDDRVVRSLCLPPGPPFPQGRELEQGDWSLLDPVRRRGRTWRPTESPHDPQ